MKAIICLSGKQFHVGEGDILEVFRLKQKKGEQFTIQEVVALEKEGSLITDKDILKDCSVVAEVLDEKKDRKIYVFKKKKKTGYKRKKGHRDFLSVIKIVRIQSPDAKS
ncbi:MAG: 50S ribosomal protein L21 [Candidatus Omnitrophica bacterium]|nr:50S ribosomal protein L21 [Candidatus Omnitrophota bacterium]MCM8788711.1 50S ribosomal protein L21 [Candidatus Omnitrophota bacterium]